MKAIVFAAAFGALLACLYSTPKISFRELLTSLINSAAVTNYSPIKASTTTTTTTTTTSRTPSSLLGEPTLAVLTSESTFAETMIPRTIAKVFKAVEKAEGAGARVRRSVGTPHLKNLSPFLMLDHFSVGVGAGFPDHPHRGQETITYLLHGSIDHEDFAGHKGTINKGDLQFMTAGRGIVHAEMPGKSADGTPNVGLQLWVDLPKHLKYCEPRYRDLSAKEIPSVAADGDKAHIKIISGTSHGVDSVRDLAYTPVWILDVTMKPGARVEQPLPGGWNALVYTLKGKATFGENEVDEFHTVVFDKAGDGIVASTDENANEDANFVIIAGQPLDQTVVQYGPFVLNTDAEVYQAMMDYQGHSNGFERAKGWRSEIGKPMLG